MNQSIIIREDVYLGALNNVGRDRMTIGHEIGHFIYHSPSRIQLARTDPSASLPAYMDPEWQATVFAAELLVPYHLINGMTAEEVSYHCGVSLQAANIQLRTLRKKIEPIHISWIGSRRSVAPTTLKAQLCVSYATHRL